MSIYDINGNVLHAAYNYEGQTISKAYDIVSDVVFPDTPTSIKVMTYNVGQWYTGGGDNVPADKDAAYYALQNGMISANNPDVLLIEEYWKVFSKTGRTALSMLQQYFPYIHEQGGYSGYYGRCICSKYPISNYTIHNYSNNAQRYYDSCEITINGVPITFVVTHFDTDTAKRAANVQEIIPYLQTLDRFVLGGDLNTFPCASTEDSDYIAILLPLLNAGFHISNCGDFGFLTTYWDGTWSGRLDNIVTSSNITITDAYVDETKLSDAIGDKIDHMPLIATLQIGGTS